MNARAVFVALAANATSYAAAPWTLATSSGLDFEVVDGGQTVVVISP